MEKFNLLQKKSGKTVKMAVAINTLPIMRTYREEAMLKFRKKDKPNPLDVKIEAVLAEMDMTEPGSEEYAKLLASVERLHKIKAEERKDRVSRDTLAIVAGNLLGIFLIVAYEKGHVLTSKAFNSVIRPREDRNKNNPT